MNPFVLSGFWGERYFCNRQKELKRLSESFKNKRNVTLISLRRMGKSALIHYHFNKINSKSDCIYIDLFPAQNFSEFINIFANAIYEYFGKPIKQHLEDLTKLIRSLGATLSFNEITGSPEISFGISKPIKSERNLKQLVDFLETRNKRVLIAFDEFQQILTFDEKNIEAILRTSFQNVKNINFIYSGSNKGMMESMFSNQARPFYQSTEFLYLYEIEKSEYKNFIASHFLAGGKKISDFQIDFILEKCRDHTYYVQYFCNRLYSSNFNGEEEKFINIFQGILIENEPIYMNYKNLLTRTQWNLLKAIASEESVKEPLASKFLTKYKLGSPSSIQRGLESLIKNDFLIWYKDELILTDVFFNNWLKLKNI
ncbi:MAG TPA: AAA family ATPase [Ignavibacteria bacterium]|nr:AAA family ATPase [Ignavibacteria bacterium]